MTTVRKSLGRKRYLSNISFVIPFLIVYGAFVLYPVVQAVLMSFFDWDLLGSKREPIGLENYATMLGGTNLEWSFAHQGGLRMVLVIIAAAITVWASKEKRLRSGEILLIVSLLATAVLLGFHPGEAGSWNDPRFWNALKNTLIFTGISTPIIAALGLGFALLLHRQRRGIGVYRAALFLPYVLPVSIATLIWGYMLNPSRGIIAKLTDLFGIEPINWLADPRFAMSAIIITTVWWTVGFNMILFGAGLQDIDPSLYEAASLDGANSGQKFRAITIPGLQHATLLVLVTQIIASFQIFGQVNIMTGGGPGGTTDVLVRYIYQTGFRDTDLGYASAMSMFLFVVMVLVALIQFLMSRERKI